MILKTINFDIWLFCNICIYSIFVWSSYFLSFTFMNVVIIVLIGIIFRVRKRCDYWLFILTFCPTHLFENIKKRKVCCVTLPYGLQDTWQLLFLPGWWPNLDRETVPEGWSLLRNIEQSNRQGHYRAGREYLRQGNHPKIVMLNF